METATLPDVFSGGICRGDDIVEKHPVCIVYIAVDITRTGKLDCIENAEDYKSGGKLPPVGEIHGENRNAQISDDFVQYEIFRIGIIPVFLRPGRENVVERGEYDGARQAP